MVIALKPVKMVNHSLGKVEKPEVPTHPKTGVLDPDGPLNVLWFDLKLKSICFVYIYIYTNTHIYMYIYTHTYHMYTKYIINPV